MSFLDGQNAQINTLKQARLGLVLSRKIVFRNEFVGAVISGQRQSGKSMYMLMVLHELYKRDWDEVFKHVFFSMEDFIEFLKQSLQTGERIPCVAIDDAGVHFGAQQWNKNRNKVTDITSLLDTIGIITKSIILTVPNSGNLIKAIRLANFYHVEIHQGRHKFDREANGYLLHTSPKGQIYPTKEFIDTYDVRIPEPIYEKYSLMRQRYSIETLSAFNPSDSKKEQSRIYMEGNKKYCEVDID